MQFVAILHALERRFVAFTDDGTENRACADTRGISIAIISFCRHERVDWRPLPNAQKGQAPTLGSKLGHYLLTEVLELAGDWNSSRRGLR